MDNFEVVVPTEMAIAAEAVKNGDVLTVTGQDMDLVVSVTFPEMTESVAVTEATATQITVTVPDLAQSGDLALNMASGQSVTVPFVTVKPTITAFNPTALTAGEVVTITGTDLDLVASVAFEGEDKPSVTIVTQEDRENFIKEQEEALKQNPDLKVEEAPEVSYIDENTLRITVPLTARACAPKLVMKNGEEVETTTTLNISPATDPVITAIEPGSVKAGEEITITGLNINTVENFYFGDVKVTEYGTRTATEVTLTVPAEVTPDTYYIRMVNYAGDEIISSVPVTIESAEIAVMDEEHDLGSWASEEAGGAFRIYKADLTAAGFAVGTTMRIYVEQYAYTQIQINDANWGGWTTLKYDADTCPATIDIAVTSELYNRIMDTADGWSDTGIIIQGEGCIISRVTVFE